IAATLAAQPTFVEKVRLTNEIPIGTVISSLLSADKFRSEYGSNWIPADGREAPKDCRFTQLTGKSSVPDMRGIFIRGLDVFEKDATRTDGLGDPDSKRQPGSYQSDSFARHEHEYTSQVVGGGGRAEVEGGNGYPRLTLTNKTASAGGEETRPKNVAVYYY